MPEQDGEESVSNNPDDIILNYLRGNENVNNTQIENLQIVLDKIKKGNGNYSIGSNLELNNQIRILSYDVE